MDAGALLAVIALILAIVSFFRPEPLLTVAVVLLSVAVLVGVSPLELD